MFKTLPSPCPLLFSFSEEEQEHPKWDEGECVGRREPGPAMGSSSERRGVSCTPARLPGPTSLPSSAPGPRGSVLRGTRGVLLMTAGGCPPLTHYRASAWQGSRGCRAATAPFFRVKAEFMTAVVIQESMAICCILCPAIGQQVLLHFLSQIVLWCC